MSGGTTLYIEAPHVVEWRNCHAHRILDATYSSRFEAYLDMLPWAGSHIDWRLIEHHSQEVPVEVTLDFLESCRRTPWGRHEYLLVMYWGQEPSLLCRTDEAIFDLDLLYSGSPGTRFVCGADLQDGSAILSFREFVEYDGFAQLTYPVGGFACESLPEV